MHRRLLGLALCQYVVHVPPSILHVLGSAIRWWRRRCTLPGTSLTPPPFAIYCSPCCERALSPAIISNSTGTGDSGGGGDDDDTSEGTLVGILLAAVVVVSVAVWWLRSSRRHDLQSPTVISNTSPMVQNPAWHVGRGGDSAAEARPRAQAPAYATLEAPTYGSQLGASAVQAGGYSVLEHSNDAVPPDVELRFASVLDYRIRRPLGKVTMLHGSLGTHRAFSQI